MSIRINQAAGIQQQEEARRKQKAAGGFEALLAEQTQGGVAQGVADGAGLSRTVLQSLETLQGVEKGEETSALSGLSADTAGRLDGILAGFEEYAQQLGTSEPDLKSSFALLQRMSGQIAEMRAAFPDLAEQSPELAAMVNELDVMATTETFKFNRGDYL